MDTEWEIRMDRIYQEKEQADMGMREYCETCPGHNEKCPYYDEDEESWDEQMCHKENDWEWG